MVNPAFEREGAHQLTGGIFPVYPLTAGITNRFLTGLVRAGLACLPQVQETWGTTCGRPMIWSLWSRPMGAFIFPLLGRP